MNSQSQRLFLLVSIAIVLLDGVMVWANYVGAQQSLNHSLERQGEQIEDGYQVTLDQVSTFMQQTATYIANDSRINQLFLEGKRAVEAEGGGPGGPLAAEKRQALYNLVSESWDEMTRDYKGRQLHFHLPPDYSFLRVHKPEKFGDDLSSIRHTIVAANTTLEKTKGFESGRVYAGIRGVVPVFANDPITGQEVHVGALEAGMSFNMTLEQLKENLGADFAVMMTLSHAQQTMWPDYLKEYLKQHPVINNHLLEASTNRQALESLLEDDSIVHLLSEHGSAIAMIDDHPVGVTSFALRDFLGDTDPNQADVGTILIWMPADQAIADFQNSVRNSLIIAILGFLLIECILYCAIRSSDRAKQATIMAKIDPLTQVPNRRDLHEQASTMRERAQRANDNLAVMMLDLDNFKTYNDRHGHLLGDECLVKVSQALKEILKRDGDYLARFGGEEFILMLCADSEQQLMALAEQVRSSIASLQIPHPENPPYKIVTVSVGVTLLKGKESMSLEHIIAIADEALYEAKKQGRNRVVRI